MLFLFQAEIEVMMKQNRADVGMKICGEFVLRAGLLFLALAFCRPCLSQDVDKVAEEIADRLEEGLYGSDADIAGEDVVSHLQRLARHPVNINSATRRQLSSMMLLTDFQIESILSRINSSGAILSYSELSLLYGFDEKEVERIRPYITLGPATRKRQGFLKDQQTSIYARYQRAFNPDAEQYLVRTRFSYLDRLDLSAVYKGAATSSSSSSLSTFGASCSDLRLGKVCVDRLVFGDFYARFGQGLAAWNGYSFSMASESMGFVKNAEPVSLYTSTDTSKLLRGAAATVSVGRFSVSGGYSFRNSEYVARVAYRGKRIRCGISYCGIGTEGNVLAADIVAGIGGAVLYAEAARSAGTSEGYAFLGGMSLDAGSYAFHLLGRYYQNGFSSPIGGAYSSISRTENQQGVSLRITGPVYRKLGFAAGADYTAYPEPRYHVDGSSCAVRCYVKLEMDDSGFGTPARNQLWLRGSVKYDLAYVDSVSETVQYSARTGGTLFLGRHLSLMARAEANTSEGRAASVSLKGSFFRGKVLPSCGVIFYYVPKWEGRIYFPQTELPYSFSSTLLYGRGTDGWAMIKARLSHRLSLYLKYQYNRGKTILKGALSAEL